MIIAEIGRGLGNSMYVYAAALALAKHHKAELKLDTSYLRSWPRWEKHGGLWDFELGKFNISANEATSEEIKRFVFKTGFRPIDRFVFKKRLFDKGVVYFPSCGSNKDFFKISDNSYLRGYLGRERFFRSIKNIILKEFTLRDEFKKNIKSHLENINKSNSVSIQVRRGDLLNIKNTNILGENYYKKAIEIIKSRIKNPKFYVFSDDIEWCKAKLSKLHKNIFFIEDVKEGYYALELMRLCKHNIIANSAMGWWAAYLNKNNRKLVIAPKNFTHFKGAKIDPDVLPKTWIKI